MPEMTLHEFLDTHYGPKGSEELRARIVQIADLEARSEATGETPLHVAVRRRRLDATRILLDSGAEIDAKTTGGKTAWVHAIRRGFVEVAAELEARGANTTLSEPDQLAVLVTSGRLEEAKALLHSQPGIVRTGNPEEDRLLADQSGRNPIEPVALLIEAGADLEVTALDDGTALHQAAWFGQPQNARLLIDAGAPLERFCSVHNSSPLGWAVHGARYSGGATERQEAYVELAKMLLAAGAELRYPGDGTDAYRERLLRDASPAVHAVLEAHQA